MEIIFFGSLFIIGMALGSFMNVLSLRYNPEKSVFGYASIGGRSHCVKCGKTLAWHELIPLLSFFIQRGKCRLCKTKLTFQYPIVEFLSGAIVAWMPLFLNNLWGVSTRAFVDLGVPLWYYVLVFLWIAALLVFTLISLIDLKHYIIPDELNGAIGIIAIFVIGIISFHINDLPLFSASFLKQYSLLFSLSQNVVINHLFAAIVSGTFFLVLNILSKGRGMGFGDVKLAFVAGLLLGWPDSLLAVILSFIFGGILGAYLVFSGARAMKDKVPFGPIFILGCFAVIFFGVAITGWYLNLFGLFN